MRGLRALLVKVVKNKAKELNTIGFIEKQGDLFIHTDVTKELRDALKVKSEHVIRKSLVQIHPEDVASERRKLYEQAWRGETVIYTAEYSLNSEDGFIGVLMPMKLRGQVVKIMAFISPAHEIPKQLLAIA